MSAWAAIGWALEADWRGLLERFALLLAAYVVGAVLGGWVYMLGAWIVAQFGG